jgi:hypothetical protein
VLAALVTDDPVRPEIPLQDRIGPNAEILVARQGGEPAAVVCVRYCPEVPATVDQLLDYAVGGSVAVFYTIWSYKPGAGARLIFQAREHVMATRPHVSRFVTLSPTTEMARRFHIKNGAVVFRSNADTVNYEYT